MYVKEKNDELGYTQKTTYTHTQDQSSRFFVLSQRPRLYYFSFTPDQILGDLVMVCPLNSKK